MNPLCIDLGARNTRVAIISDGRPYLIKLNNLPSIDTCVYIGKSSAVGNDAVTVGEQDTSYLFTNLVNLIGRSFNEEDIDVLKSYLPYSVLGGKNHRCMAIGLNQGNEIAYDPTVILSFYLRNIIDKIYDTGINQKFDSILLSYPHTFTDLQKDQLRKVANYTGQKHVDLISDTLAACLYSGVLNESNSEVAIVVDCGVCTFDVSVIKCTEGCYEVIASEGFNNIGGDTFTNVLFTMALKQLNISYGSLPVNKHYKLHELVEEAKITMSTTNMDVPITFDDRTITLSKDKFENECSKVISRCCKEITKVIDTAQSKNLIPTALVLAGRATQLPCLQRAIISTANVNKIYQNVDSSVALGLAMYSLTDIFCNYHKECQHCNPFLENSSSEYGTIANPAVPVILDYDFSNYDENEVDNSQYPLATPMESFARDNRAKLNERFIKIMEGYEPKDEESRYVASGEIVRDVVPGENVMEKVKIIKLIDRDMYNVGVLFNLSLFKNDLDLLYKRNDEFSQTCEKTFMTNGKENKIRIILYQGKSENHKKCTKIREYWYVVDNDHIDNKSHRYILNISMQSSASINLKLTWEDNGKEIQIIKRKDLTDENWGSVHRCAALLNQ